ncbi:MAG: hypothetical protein R3288_03330 [Woeseiaceae bacterium]|nr:hypothetical protein [Woeseiaceae bacterium]
MRYLVSLALGIAAGAAIALGFLYYNPFTSASALSPLMVSDQEQVTFNYSAVAEHAIAYTNNGESRVKPHPDKILQLWEAPIRETDIFVTELRGSRNDTVGIGFKLSSKSERTRVLNGEALVDSVWYLFLPDQGTLLIAQTENYWSYLRDIVVPAHWSGGNGWRGNWHGQITSGPGALGTAQVFGGSGRYRGVEAEAIETLSAKAYSSERGPVAMDGQLIVEFARGENELTANTGSTSRE